MMQASFKEQDYETKGSKRPINSISQLFTLPNFHKRPNVDSGEKGANIKIKVEKKKLVK